LLLEGKKRGVGVAHLPPIPFFFLFFLKYFNRLWLANSHFTNNNRVQANLNITSGDLKWAILAVVQAKQNMTRQ
jgi:hypothetical protein